LGAVRALQFRKEEDSGLRLGAGTAVGLEQAAEVLGNLSEDATPGQQIEALSAWIASGAHAGAVDGLERIA